MCIFMQLFSISQRLQLQNRLLHDVLLHLLADEDKRVRHAATGALVRSIPNMLFAVDGGQPDAIAARAQQLSASYLDPIMHEWPAYESSSSGGVHPAIEAALSRVVADVLHRLYTSTDRHRTVRRENKKTTDEIIFVPFFIIIFV